MTWVGNGLWDYKIIQKTQGTYKHVLEGTDVGVMWSNMVEEIREPRVNHQTWMGDHYPATCLDPDLNPDRKDENCLHYPLHYPGPLGFEA